jgi:replicative DNA helicase
VGVVIDSTQLEERYVGAVFVRPSLLDDVPVDADDCTSDRVAAILRAQRELYDRGDRVEGHAVEALLRERGQLARVGPEYLATLPLCVHLTQYERDSLLEAHRRRRTREHALKLAAACESGDDVAIAGALTALQGAQEPRAAHRPVSLRDAALEAVGGVFERVTSKATTRYGLDCLDRALGPVPHSSLVVIGADTSIGKSSLCLALAVGQAAKGQRVGIVSCEDSSAVWGSRAAARWAGVDGIGMRTGTLSQDSWRDLSALPDQCPDPTIWVDQQIGGTESDVCAAMRRLHRLHQCDVLFVDYVQTIRSETPAAKRNDQVREIAARLKGVAALLKVPLFLVSQLRRPEEPGKVREPTIFHLKETGDLENAAEVVLLLWRPQPVESPDLIMMKIAKSKWGAKQLTHPLVRDYTGFLQEAVTQWDGQ